MLRHEMTLRILYPGAESQDVARLLEGIHQDMTYRVLPRLLGSQAQNRLISSYLIALRHAVGPRLVHIPSEPSGSQRSPAVPSGRSFAQVAGAILRKQARGQNPDKDEVSG